MQTERLGLSLLGNKLCVTYISHQTWKMCRDMPKQAMCLVGEPRRPTTEADHAGLEIPKQVVSACHLRVKTRVMGRAARLWKS